MSSCGAYDAPEADSSGLNQTDKGDDNSALEQGEDSNNLERNDSDMNSNSSDVDLEKIRNRGRTLDRGKGVSMAGTLFSKSEDLSVQMHVDAGRYETPEIRLIFETADDKNLRKTFSASWRPGVWNKDTFVVEDFNWMKMTNDPEGKFPNLKEVYSDAQGDDQARTDRIVAMGIRCNYTKATDVDCKQFKIFLRNLERF